MHDPWWVSVKDFLPYVGERFLVLLKSGHIVDCAYRCFGLDYEPSFFDGLIPGKDFLWWMPIPDDSWHDYKLLKPDYGQFVIVMGMYGKISSGTFIRLSGQVEPDVCPFVFPVLFWHDVPILPVGK